MSEELVIPKHKCARGYETAKSILEIPGMDEPWIALYVEAVERVAVLEAENAKTKAPANKDWSWQCNECGADEYTSCVSEGDIEKMSCGNCGACEFHRVFS